MRKGEFNWFWGVLFTVPAIMIFTKSARMDSKERHEIQMRVKHRSDFWAKGNTFVDALRERMHRQLHETVDGQYGSSNNV